MTVAELKVACKILRIDISGITKKSDIVNFINSTGFTYEDYLEATGEQFSYKEAEEKPKEEVVVKDETKSEEKVILRMVYNRSALNVSNKAYFTIEEPYQIFNKATAEEILRLGKDEVRVATPEEVKSFYKV